MSTPIESLEPKPVWQIFTELAAVPRPSKKEEKVQAFTLAWAEKHGFAARRDAAGNIVIEVPASPGCENAPVTVLQGHLDMVCEKNAGTEFDFDNDPIKLVLDKDPEGNDIVRADGTTLGADNGIGVVMAMAAATLPEVKHGPLELLCTADEEMGMTGAKTLEPSFLKNRRMLNLDSEEDDAVYIGCAGGMDSTITFNLKTEVIPAGLETCKVIVSGLRGGHSGGDIHENRGNAIKILVRTLREAGGDDLRIAEITGGSKRNAIPREAVVTVAGPAGLADKLAKVGQTVQQETRGLGVEPNCEIKVEDAKAPAAANEADTTRLLRALTALPHGVSAVVPEIAGLVETSNSMSTIVSEVGSGALGVRIQCLSRSSSRPQLHAVVRQIHGITELAGAEIVSDNEYPGWAPNVDSKMLAVCKRVYSDLFGEEANVTAIHAGLECGLIGERMGEGAMDMASIGPRIEGAHSPDERVWVASVQKSWKLLVAILAELSKG